METLIFHDSNRLQVRKQKVFINDDMNKFPSVYHYKFNYNHTRLSKNNHD